MKTNGLTRRQLAAAVAALPAPAQNTPSPAKVADELESARGQLRQSSAVMRKVRIETSLEPSFVFRA